MSNRGRRATRLAGSFALLAMFATLLPMLAFASSASAAAPPVQDTTAFCAGGPTGNPFPDVVNAPPSQTNPHGANIACAKDAGVVQGKTDGLYHPNENTSRAQMASLVAREADLMVTLAAPGKTLNPLPAAGSNPFVDVGDPPSGDPAGSQCSQALQFPCTAPHTDNILRLNAAAITNGTDATHYSPAANITRFQMAKFEVLKLEFVTGTTLDASCGATFPDAAETDATFGSFVEKAACAGIIQGKEDGSFHGGDPLTRAQTATFEIRGLAWALGKGFITPLHGATSNQGYTVDPGLFGVKTVSTTTGTNTQRGAVTCTVKTGDTVSLGLVPFTNVNTTNNKTTFKDANQDLRADAMGAPGGPFIQSINGVAQAAGTTFVPNVVAGSDGNITFVLNSTTPNSAAGAVVFKDADTNGQLNLSSTDPNTLFGTPSETFGFGCSGAWLPVDATLGTYNLDLTDPNCPLGAPPAPPPGVIIALQVLNEFTSCSMTFHYGGSSDVYQYASNVGGPNITITKADFDKYLSGVSTGNKTAIGPTGTTRLGDFMTVNYNPGGASTFTITRDVPAAPTGLTATVGDADAQGVQNDVMLTWVAPPNPDLGGFRIFRAPINSTTGVIGAYALAPAPGNGIAPATATSYNDLNAAPGKYSYIVVAINKQAAAGPLPGPDASPDSVAAQATVTATVPTLTPISVNTSFVNGPTQTPAGTPASGGDTNILDKNDVITVTFANAAGAPFNTSPIAAAANASVTIHDDDGTVVTLTNGVNASFAVGGTNNSVLTITVTTTPTASQTNGGNAQVDTGAFSWAIDAATGITNGSGAWNLPASGQPFPGMPTFGDVEREIFPTNSTVTPNTSAGAFNFPLPPAIPFGTVPGGNVFANADNNTVTVTAGSTPGGSNTIDNGETFFVFNAAGAQIATGVYNNTTGTTVTPSPALVANTTLYVVYVDSVGTNGPCCSPAGRSLPSASSAIPAATATPGVISVTGTGGTNQITVNWTTTVQQNGAASGYQVFDASNANLVATGVTAVANGTSTTVTLNTNLVAGTTYTLRVAPGTVQNPNGNVPNQAATKAFTTVTTSAANSTLTATPTNTAANGTSTSTVTVTLKNAAGGPVVGHSVSLGQNGSAAIAGANPATTNGAGQASWTVSDSTAETVTFNAFDNTDGVAVNQTANVTFNALPTITSVVPNSGPTTGGNVVNINGTGFQPGATVTIGGNPATVNNTTPTVLTVTVPAGTAGAKNVTVNNPDGGSVTSNNAYTYTAGAPTITSVVTDPVGSRLIVTFSQSGMTCPNTANALASWVFTNQDNPNSVGNDQDGGQATGSPTSVAVNGGNTAQCFLNYAAVGTNDYGTLAYAQPAAAADQAHSAGGPVPSSNPNVTESTTPTFNSVAVVSTASAGTGQPTLTFSEPVKCSSVSAGDFTATLNGGNDAVLAVTCTGTDNATITLTLATPSNNVNDSVSVSMVGTIVDEFGNSVPAQTRSTFST